MNYILGIDLGTTNSCAAILENQSPVIVPNKEGSRITPSVIGFTEKKEILVGHIARRQAITNPQNTVFGIKRLIGRKYDSPEIQIMLETLPYNVVATENGDAAVEIMGRVYSPQEISAIILKELKENAEQYTGTTITEAIITVPAYFNDAQRQATKDAGKIAGLDVLRIINEPTAASLAYDTRGLSGTIAVYDLGGGTFDISILNVNDGVYEVLSTSGDTFLGGDDFDRMIINWIVKKFKEDTEIDLTGDKMALQRLKEAAEKAKCELSSVLETEINLPFIAADATGPKHFVSKLTRAEFEDLVKDLSDRTIPPCQEALSLAGVSKEDIDHLLLVGGQTRTPIVIKTVEDFFGMKARNDGNPDEVVGTGAAIQGSIISGDVDDIVLLDITPLSLGIETKGGLFVKLIERGSNIPTKASQIFTTVIDNQRNVKVHILQGESELAGNNISLARFELVDIPPAPKGIPRIEVVFEIDSNGIVSVSATDLDSGKAQSMRIKSTSGLTDKEISEIIDKAERAKDDEMRLKALINTKNNLEDLLSNTERSFIEAGQRGLPDEIKGKIQAALNRGREALATEDTENMKEAYEGLKELANKLGEFLLYGTTLE
jgi:molecular chaperone DnaK